jgi:hypothetical protein
VFEGGVENACDIIHENGGQVVRSFLSSHATVSPTLSRSTY